MHPVSTPRIKVCCISSVDEAWAAIRAGASALGLVSSMPGGPGVISEQLIAEIAAAVPPPIATFLLTCSQDAGAIIAQQRRCRTNTVQLCDRLTAGTYADLRGAMPGVSLVQVIHVTGPESLDEALAVAPHVDALLLDSGNPSLAVKELGGTGRVHDWSVSRRIREQVGVPVFLAGGLRAENVAEAIRGVGAFGLDLCSGVRTDGKLDEAKLARFFASVSAARGAELKLRPIEPRDDAAMAAIIRQVMPEFGAGGPGFAIHDAEVDGMSAAYARPGCAYWVVEDEAGRVVGGGGIAPLEGEVPGVCELRKMYFLPQARGRGVGERLLRQCLAFARKAEYRTCYLETLAGMTQAQKLYARLGFQPLRNPMGATGHFGCDRWYALDLHSP